LLLYQTNVGKSEYQGKWSAMMVQIKNFGGQKSGEI
jgi:hypothetical protein